MISVEPKSIVAQIPSLSQPSKFNSLTHEAAGGTVTDSTDGPVAYYATRNVPAARLTETAKSNTLIAMAYYLNAKQGC